jgi:integrase/recombinase XerD
VQLLLKSTDKSTFVGFRDTCIMMVLIDTGMRINECLNIKIEDIEFETGSLILKTTKNRTSRIVGISEPTRREIKKFIKIWLSNAPKSNYLFQSFNGENKLAIRSFQSNLKIYGEQIGIEGVRCSPHTFRHYFAINFLKNGGSTSALRTVLGHIDLAVVEKYLYWSNDEIVEQNIRYSPMNQLGL